MREPIAIVCGCHQSMPNTPLTFIFKDDGSVPNNAALPALVYKGAVDVNGKHDPASEIEKLFTANGWGHGQWRDGIYAFVHYHSMIHEALGIAHGRAGCSSAAMAARCSSLQPATLSYYRPAPATSGFQAAKIFSSSERIRWTASI